MGARWEFSLCEPQMLVLALYVRDAADLRPVTHPPMPALHPAVPVTPALVSDVNRGVVAQQWARWWQQLWLMAEEDPPRKVAPLPEQVPDVREHAELQELVQRLFTEAIEYCTARKNEHRAAAQAMLRPQQTPEGSVLVEATRRKRLRRARPVQLRVTELPLSTEQGWHDRQGHVVVSRPLRRDTVAYQQWLQPLVHGLVKAIS